IERPDYALLSAGARVVPEFTSSTLDIRPRGMIRRTLANLLGHGTLVQARPPATVLDPDNNLGKCWPMSGTIGSIGIALTRKIKIEEIVIEHVNFKLAYEIESAIKDFEIWSWNEKSNLLIKIGEGIFDINKKDYIQKFPIITKDEEEEEEKFESNLVVIKILSNSGNPDFTCLYRVRVHGSR
ncbi:hypothetical protein CROQUDRAFT_12229, partial [Cronartium quercuum f. sp. fusiforme G11]